MDDKQWDDYIRRQPGTFWGEQAKAWDKAAQPKPLSAVGSGGRRRGSGESPFEFVWSLTDWFRERLCAVVGIRASRIPAPSG